MSIHRTEDPTTHQVIIDGGEGNDDIHVHRRMVEGYEDGVIIEAHDDKGKDYQYTLTGEEVKRGGGLLIMGNEGKDVISVDGNVHADLNLSGGTGNDTIYGGGGNDTIAGGLDDDVIYGRGGNDILYGQEGDDELYGGRGRDTIHFDSDDSIVNYGNDKGDKGLPQ